MKKRLDALHYCHPVTPHSAVLVETLLNDLLKSSQLVETLKTENQTLLSRSKESTDNIAKYQREVTRLASDNNRLHLELMNTKESLSSSQEKWRVACKKLENECEDLKLLSSIQKTKYSELQTEKDELKSKLDGVLTKLYNSNNGLKDSNLSITESNQGRKQEFNITNRLKESENIRGFTRSQQEWAQELQDSDERVKAYQDQLEEILKLKEDQQQEIIRCNEKINNRDQEIQRLLEILQSGEFAAKVPVRVSKQETTEQLSLLNERLDFLNTENIQMEKELHLARSRLAQIGNVHEERDILLLKLDDANKIIAKLQENLTSEPYRQRNTKKIDSTARFSKEIQDRDQASPYY